MTWKSVTSGLLKPPVVPGLPLLGSTLELNNDFMGFLVKNYKEFGSIFRVQVPNQNFTVLAGSNEHHQPGTYAPFGLGDHICLAKGITEIQIMTIMATLLARVRLQIDPPAYKLKIAYDPNPCPKNFYVRIVEHRH